MDTKKNDSKFIGRKIVRKLKDTAEKGGESGTTKVVVTKEERLQDVLVKRKSNKVSTSLLGIVGISVRLNAKLAARRIYDVPSLMAACRKPSQRTALASYLQVDVKLVNSWVKQADLWRVQSMTPDMAYLLVLSGVRGVHDLARLDLDKAYPIIKALAASQPDFKVEDRVTLQEMIQAASDLDLYSPQGLGDFLFDDDKPDYILNQNNDAGNGMDEILNAAWKDLFEFDCTLPLPRLVSGTVLYRTMALPNENPQPFDGVKVEIEGIVSPAEDKTEAPQNPSCYTDAGGHFIITLPERYSLKETIKIIVSNASGRQEFVKSASEFLAAVSEQKLVDALQEMLSKRVEMRTHWIKNLLYTVGTDGNYTKVSPAPAPDKEKKNAYVKSFDVFKKYEEQLTKSGIKEKLEALKSVELTENDDVFDHYFSQIYDAILKNSDFRARLEGQNLDDDNPDEGFIVVKEVFQEKTEEAQKTLPSVKLMGEGEGSVRLKTDTAPSRMFSYSMFQRLVEPKIVYNVDKNVRSCEREEVTKPIDVSAIADGAADNYSNLAKASSLGVGYVLNMHQAWVPDGFALGDLLYSLILAPGEEQRLVVRETNQAYSLTDEASGTDDVNETTTRQQNDDVEAIYDYALAQTMAGRSGYSAESSTYGGSVGFSGFGFGVSASYSKTKSKGSSNASQENGQNETSSAAQSFQQALKTASNRHARANRLSISNGTSNVNESLATKIVANHNHMHTMTVQYWEVMRRYKVETSVDSVNLALFVPVDTVPFLTAEQSVDSLNKTLSKKNFNDRYSEVLKHIDVLSSNVPSKFRQGMNLIRKYSALADWYMEDIMAAETQTLRFNLNVKLLSFDLLSVYAYMKDGKKVAGSITYETTDLPTEMTTSLELKEWIRNFRNQTPDQMSNAVCFIALPMGSTCYDVSHIVVEHSMMTTYYMLHADESSLTKAEKKALKNLKSKQYDLAQDNKGSKGDIKDINHYLSLLPEAFRDNFVTLTPNLLAGLGYPMVCSITMDESARSKGGDNTASVYTLTMSDNRLKGKTVINLSNNGVMLRHNEIRMMEEAFRHIVNNGLRYSQVIWNSLSVNERILLFDRYSVKMDFSKLRENSTSVMNEEELNKIPLLNCINVHNLLGIYGNCMIFPFTFPQELAEILGRTAKDVQDQIYRYHASCFRAPTTVISVPTKGMIGEAVLGETNVSEEIDLTRFWNWQDSPIDKMDVTDASGLKGTDYLADKKTKDITSLNLQSATLPTPTTAPDLISKLVGKATPQFSDMTGQNMLSNLGQKTIESATTTRTNEVNAVKDMATKSLESMQEILLQKMKMGGGSGKNDEESEEEKAKKAAGVKDKVKAYLESAAKISNNADGSIASFTSDFEKLLSGDVSGDDLLKGLQTLMIQANVFSTLEGDSKVKDFFKQVSSEISTVFSESAKKETDAKKQQTADGGPSKDAPSDKKNAPSDKKNGDTPKPSGGGDGKKPAQ